MTWAPELLARAYYSDDSVVLVHGDCLKVLAELPSESVDAVVTDPPYSSGGTTQAARKAGTRAKYESTDNVNQSPEFVGDSRDQRAYQYWSALWMAECLRIAKPGALLMVFTDWRQYAATADGIQAGGWIWRGALTWVKPPQATRPQKGRFSQSCEYVLWGTKGAREIDIAGDAATPAGWFEAIAPRGAQRVHMTEKPLDLMRHLCKPLTPASVVLDPFAGSGTTGVAAKSEGHRFIGIEATAQYSKVAARRLAQDALDFGESA